MNRIRKTTVLLTVFALLLTLWAPTAVSAETPAPAAVQTEAQQEELLYFGRSILAQMDNSEALCYAYDTLVEGCKVVSDHIDISHPTYTINCDEAITVYDMVMADHPAFFWLTDGIRMQGSSHAITAFLPSVRDSVTAQREALAQRVDELTADLDGKSDYEKSLILHDRMCHITNYIGNADDQTAIGSLIKGQAVCAGYARGYQILMQAVGIPVYHVVGTSHGQGHAWNLVRLDGEWYYTDVTWDDQNDNGGYIYYAYLNTTYDRMAEDHTATAFAAYLPHSTATAANLHVRNGWAMDTPDVSRMAAILKEGSPARVYVTGDMQTFIHDLGDRMSAIVKEMMGRSYGYSYRLSMLGRELILALTVSHTHLYNTVTVPPTCTADGTVTQTCRDCGHTLVETTPAIGHDLALDWWQTEEGHGHLCNRCDTVDGFEAHTYSHDGDTDCITCGYVTEPAIVYGDANGDGKVNNRDLGQLQQYLNGWEVAVNTAALDVTGDGRVNNRDLGRLQQYLNGWDVELH